MTDLIPRPYGSSTSPGSPRASAGTIGRLISLLLTSELRGFHSLRRPSAFMIFCPVIITGYYGWNMREVPTTEAKSRLAELLRAVEYGETIAITRHGKTVARLTPALDQERASQKEAVERFRAWREQRPRTGMTREEILTARHEGHRW